MIYAGKTCRAMKVNLWARLLCWGLFGTTLLFFLSSCGTMVKTSSASQTEAVLPAGASPPKWIETAKEKGFTSHNQYIAAEATAMANGLYGSQANQYYSDDPTMAAALAYWKSTCQNADASLCNDARSGNLQCVEFVTGIFAAIDDQLPYIGNADQFWGLYQGKAGWQEIAAGSALKDVPEPGDIIAWSGNDNGHLAVVVDRDIPTADHAGRIVIAQSNAPYAFEQLVWHSNGQIDSWSGYKLQGFIRQQELAPCLVQKANPVQEQWEVLAIEAAVHYGMPSKYLLRQLCQSGFQSTNAQGQVVVSTTGAIGIAQLQSSVAAQIPRCITDVLDNAVNCMKMPGSLPAGTGIDPAKPTEAIPAAAYQMSLLYQHYLTNQVIHVPQDDFEAYKMALAAYNAGEATIDSVVQSCGKTGWQSCLNEQQKDEHTDKYVSAVLSKD